MGCGSTKSDNIKEGHSSYQKNNNGSGNVNGNGNYVGSYTQNALNPQGNQNNQNQNNNLILHTNSNLTKYPKGKAILMRRFDL